MDIPSTSSEDGFFYPSDFDDDLEFVVGVDELFHDVLGGQNPLLPYSGVLDYYSSDNESNGGGEKYSFGDEEVVDIVGQQSSHNLDFVEDEAIEVLSFDNVSVGSTPSGFIFTKSSLALMIQCVVSGLQPSFLQIRTADPNFLPVLHRHGRPVDPNDHVHIVERWARLQRNLKVLDSPHGLLLSPSSDKMGRGITSSDLWHSIVKQAHCYVSGKHSSLKSTVHFIREQWSTDVRVGGIPHSFIERCIQSCATCSGLGPFWDEVVKVPLEQLQDTLNNICAKHIVVLRVRSKRQTTSSIVTYYYCHRGGKQRIRKKKEEVNYTRQERKSYK